jgi:hypothetical protein
VSEAWAVYLDGATAKVALAQRIKYTGVPEDADDDGFRATGTWEVVIHRGAPAWESHPELRRGIVSVMTLGLFKDLMRPWTWEIPAKYLGRSNEGELREFMLLRGGSLNWTLALKFPRNTPDYVFERVALGFGATPYASPEPNREPSPPAPDLKPKSAKAKALRMRRR